MSTNNQIITILEHKEWPDTQNEKEIAKKIKLQSTDYNIIKFLEEKKIVNFVEHKDKGVSFKAANFIGTVQFSEFKLEIIPKIFRDKKREVWKNVAQCMHYARNYSPDKIINYEKIPIENNELILQDFLIWTLIHECKELLKRGLLKSYVTHEENLPFLKGKLILKYQFQNDMQKKVQFFNEYDELEYDNIENRIILQTLVQCRRIAINNELKKEVTSMIHQFSGIIQEVPINIEDVKRLSKKYTRQNFHYKNSHVICEMILENKGISDFYVLGKKSSFSIPFFVDMNKIFEDFVTRMFKDYHENNVRVVPQAGQKAWKVKESKSGIKMIPDIVLENKNEITIIDVKYKDGLKISDLYQIGFYIHEYRSKNKNQHIDKAFAILPKFSKELQDQKTFEAEKSGVKIHAKYISIEEFLDLIKRNDVKELKEKIKKSLLNQA